MRLDLTASVSALITVIGPRTSAARPTPGLRRIAAWTTCCQVPVVGRLPGVESVKVHFASARIVIVHDPAQVDTDALVAAVREAGYLARPAAF